MPRPKLKQGSHRKNIALTLPPNLIDEVKTICAIGGWSVSAITEKALTYYLAALNRKIGEKCAEILDEKENL